MDIDAVLAKRVRDLRQARQLSLVQLAELSGVSRSMISLIERQETSPTAAVLGKLASAFGISLPMLFAGEAPPADPRPVSRHAEQAVWTDPASGYKRRQLSPQGVGSPIALVEVSFPAGQTVVFDNPVPQQGIEQQLWVVRGGMDITLGGHTWHLATGDCLAMLLGERITFHNPNPQPARYVLAQTVSTAFSRRSP